MKKTLLLLILPALFFNCQPKTTKSLVQSNSKDSTNIVIRKDSTWYKDSTLTVSADSTKIQATVTVDNLGRVNLPEIVIENTRMKTTTSIIDGKVKTTCVCKELEIRVKLQQRLIEGYQKLASTRQKSTHEIVTVREAYTPAWKNALALIGVISLISIGLYIYFKK